MQEDLEIMILLGQVRVQLKQLINDINKLDKIHRLSADNDNQGKK